MQKFISAGIDIGSQKHRIALMTPAKEVIFERFITHRHADFKLVCQELKSLSQKYNLPIVVGIEGYNGYAAPFDKYLINQGFEVKQINNLTLNRYRQLFGQPYKTDEYDARLIASYLQQPVESKSNNYQEKQITLAKQVSADIKLLSRHQQDLIKDQTRCKNRLRKLLLSYWPEIFDLYANPFSPNCLALIALGKTPAELVKITNRRLSTIKPESGKRGLGPAKAQQLKNLIHSAAILPEINNRANALVAANYAKRIQVLEEEITQLTLELSGLLAQHPSGDVLLSEPGIGIKLASRIVGETVDISRFSTLDKYCAYSGVVCLRNDSGNKKRSKSSKQVNHILKDTYMKIALTSLRINPASAAYYQRKIQAGHKHFSALKCLAHQICKVTYKLITANSTYDQLYKKAA